MTRKTELYKIIKAPEYSKGLRRFLGAQGFYIELEGSFAQQALRTEMPKQDHKDLKSQTGTILDVFGFPNQGVTNPVYSFFANGKNDSYRYLLEFCSVGAVSNLAIKPEDRERLIKGSHLNQVIYRTINVNNPEQSQALEYLWKTWFHTTFSKMNSP